MEMILINKCNSKYNHTRGMTLIELMIAIAVIGLLSAIAYPAYTNHILKANRIAVLADIAKIQLEIEEKYINSYSSIASSIISGGTCSFCDTQLDKYTLSFEDLTATTYTIKAVPKNEQQNDTCAGNSYNEITLNQFNVASPSECW
ncbi:type IV pilin protein [Aliivibrio fischeri]|uniref:Pili subunit PilA1 n=1 Tax=Aliivibrio fischeri (strain ATCC 700601 / ES114) TaxID=312309 RepID=Q5E7C9_ALIF1|nr:type IV pilin protein [Aliivibrio fischeri]AAW85067.1 pili subunit PilA1 [Aliivibrio fischeri ES114]KLU77325.1 fimbrial protein [Aliivibrio fischeri]MBP3141129.1 prepilin-type N-terminal cleavage/methylation domain-containing protein [Aliivibrio fischeri]MBP3155574.1 prepilin-type N-terminal cleavage/methylation domain-containing protein [Aliivibrio fischeri]MCE7573743.1 prepilin-type N-terminal cleavage/methylation domain-containing protein [Aliivibrio fischeri]